MHYSVDTSSILDAWRRYYPPDVFPALWTNLDRLIASGSLRATDEVRIELAQIEGCAVVTGERMTNNMARPNIPDVCRDMGIRSLNILDLIREQRWQF